MGHTDTGVSARSPSQPLPYAPNVVDRNSGGTTSLAEPDANEGPQGPGRSTTGAAVDVSHHTSPGDQRAETAIGGNEQHGVGEHARVDNETGDEGAPDEDSDEDIDAEGGLTALGRLMVDPELAEWIVDGVAMTADDDGMWEPDY